MNRCIFSWNRNLNTLKFCWLVFQVLTCKVEWNYAKLRIQIMSVVIICFSFITPNLLCCQRKMEITLYINSRVVFVADVRPSYVRYHPFKHCQLCSTCSFCTHHIIITQFKDFLFSKMRFFVTIASILVHTTSFAICY